MALIPLRRAILVSPHFPPSNLAGVQRARLMARELRDFGWEPVVIAVDARHYEEANDKTSLALLPEGLRVERVGALPARLCRPLGFGDIALRGQWALRRRVAEIVRGEPVDLIFGTVLPGYTSLVGARAKRRFGLPFVLDYQDPWVSDWGARQPRFSKAGLSHWLATKLEPGAVAAADALTAVSDRTLDTLRSRKLIRPGLPVETIPIGAEPEDHAVAARVGRSWIEGRAGRLLPAAREIAHHGAHGATRPTGTFHLAYLGTVIEGMIPTLRTLFGAVRALLNANPEWQLRIHFIGTSAQPNGCDTLGLAELAAECGVGGVFRLEPRRIGYLDALRTMQDADALLLLGSQDPHYTASKIFPCWLSGKPVLGVFHSASTVNELARELGGIGLVNYDTVTGAESRVAETTRALRQVVDRGTRALPPRNEGAFGPYSTRGVARRFAELFDRITGNSLGHCN
ncbi:MAG: glycosyltransferase [Verrucomicrobiae bacterium]|nr:glycosyltransferase [Verrucomicrobiae bacterium]